MVLSLTEKLNQIKLNIGEEELSLEDKLKQIKMNLQTTIEEVTPTVTTPAPATTSMQTMLGIGGQAKGEVTLPGTKPLIEGLPMSKPEDKPVLADINKSIPSIAKGVWYGIITLPQAIGSLMSQWGETEQVISDPTKFVSEPKWEGVDKKIFETMYSSRKLLNKQIGQAGKVVSEKGQELIKANQAYTEKYLPPADTSKLNKFLFELGAGSSSLALAVGVSLVTGNAGAAAVAFGGLASGRTYQEARESGVEPLKASALGALNFATEAGLEYLGVDFLIKRLPYSRLASMAMKGASEFGQEYLQEAGSNIVAKVGWDKAGKWNEGSARAGVMGFILGAGAEVTIQSIIKEGKAPVELVKPVVEKAYEQMKAVTDNISFDNIINQAKTDPEIKKTIEEIKTVEPTPEPIPAELEGLAKEARKVATDIENKAKTISKDDFVKYYQDKLGILWKSNRSLYDDVHNYLINKVEKGELESAGNVWEGIKGIKSTDKQIYKSDNITVKTSWDIIQKLDINEKNIISNFAEFIKKEYPDKKLDIRVGEQPISIAGKEGFRITTPTDADIDDMFPYYPKIKDTLKKLEEEGVSRKELWTGSDMFHELAHTLGIKGEVEADKFAIKMMKKWATTQATEKPAVVEAPAPVTGKGKVSKIAGSIEAKSIEQGLTKGYGHLAEYTPIVIKEQAQKATDLINSNIDEARKVIRGEKPLPEGLKGTALITAMEERIKKTADGELASELASSPLVSGTSAAAQELRLAAERDPESPVNAIQKINKLLEERASKKFPGKILNKAKSDLSTKYQSEIKSEVKKTNTRQSWQAFIESIRCA